MWRQVVLGLLIFSVTESFREVPALSFSGNSDSGKRLFLSKGKNDKACMTCHPKGLTAGDVIRGKNVPNLTEVVAKLSQKKIRSKVIKHLLQEIDMDVTDDELEDLCTFVSDLPSKGFGPVPSEWEAHVKKYVD